MSAAAQIVPQLRLLLLGLEPKTASQIVTATPEHWAFVQQDLPHTVSGCRRLLAESAGHVVFCPAKFPLLPHLIAAANLRQAPVVVVADHPTDHEWLDVLDAGASDYIAPPFDAAQMRWLIEVCLSRPALAPVPPAPEMSLQASAAS